MAGLTNGFSKGAALALFQRKNAALEEIGNLTPSDGQLLKRAGGVWTAAALQASDIPDLSGVYQPLNATLTSLSGKSLQGSGDIVLATSPTIVTPTIASLTNAQHSHQNAAGGGSLDAAAIGSGVLDNARVNWATPSAIGTGTPNGGTFNGLTATSLVLNSTGNEGLTIRRASGAAGFALGTATTLKWTIYYNLRAAEEYVIRQGGVADWFRINFTTGYTGIGRDVVPLAPLHVLAANSTVNAVTIGTIIGNNTTSGTPTTSFGSGLAFQAESSTTENRDLGGWEFYWNTATDASRASGASVYLYNIGVKTSVLDLALTSLAVRPDTDGTARIYRMRLATPTSDNYFVSHVDFTTSSNYNGPRGNASGDTWLNAASGRTLALAINATDLVTLTAASLIVNEAGGDVDVRMEGDTDANLFVLDAGLDVVSIGEAGVSGAKLNVAGLLRTDSFRIDQAPTAETPSATHTVTVNLNGTDYKLLCVPA